MIIDLHGCRIKVEDDFNKDKLDILLVNIEMLGYEVYFDYRHDVYDKYDLYLDIYLDGEDFFDVRMELLLGRIAFSTDQFADFFDIRSIEYYDYYGVDGKSSGAELGNSQFGELIDKMNRRIIEGVKVE